MITAIFFKDSAGTVKAFTVSGHAGFADSGEDIVCAGVSALSINTVNSIEKFTSDRVTANIDDSGLLTMRFDSSVSKESELLINSLILGLEGIKRSYGEDDYLQIKFEEV